MSHRWRSHRERQTANHRWLQSRFELSYYHVLHSYCHTDYGLTAVKNSSKADKNDDFFRCNLLKSPLLSAFAELLTALRSLWKRLEETGWAATAPWIWWKELDLMYCTYMMCQLYDTLKYDMLHLYYTTDYVILCNAVWCTVVWCDMISDVASIRDSHYLHSHHVHDRNMWTPISSLNYFDFIIVTDLKTI